MLGRFARLCVVLMTTLAASSAHAWWDVGHMQIAAVARVDHGTQKYRYHKQPSPIQLILADKLPTPHRVRSRSPIVLSSRRCQ